jgi:hypothetical protein
MGCRKLGAVTYPDAEVIELLNERVIPTKLDLTGRSPEILEVLRAYRLLWAPGFVMLNPTGQEIRRWLGYQPPRDFLAEIRVALAKVDYLHKRFDRSFRGFRDVADMDPPAPVSAEAVYWAGVAAYRRDGADLEFLRVYWRELQQRFPESRWWTHADVY